jgi:hypothetical protein
MNFGSARTNICAGEALRMMFVSTGYLLIFLPGSAMIWARCIPFAGAPTAKRCIVSSFMLQSNVNYVDVSQVANSVVAMPGSLDKYLPISQAHAQETDCQS